LDHDALTFLRSCNFPRSVPADLFHSHHEEASDRTDLSLAFVGLHASLSLFNCSAFILLLPRWPALDAGGDALGQLAPSVTRVYVAYADASTAGKLAALRMLVVHGSAFAVKAVADFSSGADEVDDAAEDAMAVLIGTRALLRLYSISLCFHPLLLQLFIF
jgi:hypothetical protein